MCGIWFLCEDNGGTRINAEFKDRDKGLCWKCIDEKKKKKTTKYKGWTNGMLRRLQEEEEMLDKLEHN